MFDLDDLDLDEDTDDDLLPADVFDALFDDLTVLDILNASDTVHSETIAGITLDIVQVSLPLRASAYQLYAENQQGRRVLVGLFRLYPAAAREVEAWRGYLAGGGTLDDWVERHPEGVRPR
jgi:hypothetical protein